MDAELHKRLQHLVYNPGETSKMDFKREMYKIGKVPSELSHQEKSEGNKQREDAFSEMAKDIIAITNGNIGTSRETGYLIIGANEKLDANGKPTLFDVDYSALPPFKDIRDRVNSFLDTPIAHINFEKFEVDGYKLLAIIMPPSPYLHQLNKQLLNYSPTVVLLRRGDGEKTHPAKDEEKEIIRGEKRKLLSETGMNAQKSPQDMERRKLTLEVYDRKIKTYQITRSFVSHVMAEGTVKDIQTLLKFASDTDEAIFLFDREVADYLQEIYQKAVSLYAVNNRLANPNLPVGNERNELAEQDYQLLTWFMQQIDVYRDIFYKHISL
ncbi:MAG: hypothetical protein RLZZ511_4296 [Cyanobacteriota bacterium]|jgi:hypothetical protein